jgi:aminopeptidase N
MKRIFTLLISTLFVISGISAQDMSHERGSHICSHKKANNPHDLKSFMSPNTPKHKFNVLNYSLEFDLYDNFVSPYTQTFDASNTITFEVDTALNLIKLNAVNTSLTIHGVSMAATSFDHSQDTLTIFLDQTYNPGDIVEVKIDYSHKEVEDGAFYVSGGFVFTDNEPEGARKWFPCYDHPADKATTELIAKVPSDVLLGSNGMLADSTTVADTTWFHWSSRDPVTTYLTVISAKKGWNLDIVYWDRPSTPGDPMPIRFYYNNGENPDYIEGQVPLMADYFSEYYGEHPFEKDGFATLNSEFTWGGMENQTLTSLCSNCWGESLITHEFAHQWFGDMISPGTWADLWLNEGFATWSEAFWWESSGGYSAYKDDIENNASYYLNNNPGFPIYNPDWAVNTPPNNTLFNYAITYCKSSCALHLLRYSLGDEIFFQAIYDYATDTIEFKYKNAVTEDFQSKMEASSGQDLEWFFSTWVKTANHPKYNNTYNFIDNGDGTWNVDFMVNQTQTNAGFFPIPIELLIYFQDASDTTIRVMNDVNLQLFSFTFDKEPGVMFFDFHNEIVLKTASLSVGIDDTKLGNQTFSLSQNYPNPASDQTNISFTLSEASDANISVYDVSGKKVLQLLDAYRGQGTHLISADVSQLKAGVYYYRLEAGGMSASKRLVIVE